MTTSEPILYDTTESPIGELLLTGDETALRGVRMQEGPSAVAIDSSWRRSRAAFAPARRQLAEYFAGKRTEFELELAPAGTRFQRRVWSELERIPHAETISYTELARRVGRPAAARACGAANGRNPLSIVVPCHRVIAADGALSGFAGGIERKRFLLAFEAGLAQRRTYTLLGADGRTYESRRPGTIGGHRRNRIYGRLDCAGARRWIDAGHYVRERVFFADERTARAAGYRPCARCMPERYREWKLASGG